MCRILILADIRPMGYKLSCCGSLWSRSTLYIPSTLNIDLILWHTQLIVCAENVKSWFKSEILAEMIG